ncbi:MAG: transposase [Candidatus Melainabacteria bacterium]|nr:MAG: transposase [Candidatus Melainabacteria bacterium]
MQEDGVLLLTDREWIWAKKRSEVIAPLAQEEVVGLTAAEEAAAMLGISSRQVYRLVKRYRMGQGLVTDMARSSPPGGKGKSRISPEVEVIIAEVLKSLYLSRQRRSRAVIAREIRMRCIRSGQQAPTYNTIDARIETLDPLMVTRKRQGGTAARRLQPAAGEMPPADGPMAVVQIDHTKMDVEVVDEASREAIGRPSLTLAIDVFTRCIVGMLLTLEAPSTLSVGLCLVHVVMDKSAWLERFGLDIRLWPMRGKPKKIHVDNAPEFHSEALKRGCEQYGIEQDYRPKGQPHFGGIIERVIGTAMTMSHEVPGTTFSNVQKLGTDKPERTASLTLSELEKWLVLAIARYHGTIHGTLTETPAAVWKRSIEAFPIVDIRDKQTFLIDFLPVIERRVTRQGFLIDHITYFGDVLKPWIASRDRLGKFIIRRDPRDLSRIWVLDPESKLYFDIPYRTLSRPPVTQWEHRKAVENLRKRGLEQVDEAAIFSMIEEMREITESAVKERKRARRDKNRRAHLAQPAEESTPIVSAEEVDEDSYVKPFEVEEWLKSVEFAIPEDETGTEKLIEPFDVEEW